jgi:AcrR family transcriptional regulator
MTSSDRAESLKRSLALLWGTTTGPSRGPRPGLSRERIVRAAVDIADAEGLAALSMRRVAGALGAGAMTLYRYVPGKDELLDLMVDEVYAEDLPLDETGSWRERLESACRQEWRHYHRHPWLLHVPQGRPLLGPNSMRATEATLRILDGTGLDPVEMIDAIVTTSSFVAGLARTSVEASRAERDTGISDEEWWLAQRPYLDELMAGGAIPLLSRVGEGGGFEGSPNRGFEFGLQRILDGIEALIVARTTGP